jgi:hypothetical protein
VKRKILISTAASLIALTVASSALATTQGRNGRILYQQEVNGRANSSPSGPTEPAAGNSRTGRRSRSTAPGRLTANRSSSSKAPQTTPA